MTMGVYVDHVGFKTTDLEASVKFFEDVFGMTVREVKGEAPSRKLWMDQGLQLNEAAAYDHGENAFHHLALHVDDKAEILSKIGAYGCRQLEGKDHWFAMPDGMLIELICEK